MQRLSIIARVLVVAWVVAVAFAGATHVLALVRLLQGASEAHAALYAAARISSGLAIIIPALGAFDETFRADVLLPIAARILRLASGDYR